MANPVAGVATGLFGNLLTGVISLLGFLLVGGAIVGAAFYVRYLRQFDIKAEIISTRANIGGIDQHKIIFDKAGLIYSSQDKGYYFRIKGMKVDLPAPPFNVLIPTDKGNMVKIWQKSAEEYVFLLPDQINKNIIIRQDGKQYATSQLVVKQVEGDVAYWNIKRKEKNKKLFDPDTLLMRLLPLIVPMLMFVLVIFMTWMVLKNFDVLAGVAESLKETAQILKGSSTAVVTTSG
jgi:hypothetical protein